jgi:hypothetical protein
MNGHSHANALRHSQGALTAFRLIASINLLKRMRQLKPRAAAVGSARNVFLIDVVVRH